MALTQSRFTTLIVDDLKNSFNRGGPEARKYRTTVNKWFLRVRDIEDPGLINWWDEDESEYLVSE